MTFLFIGAGVGVLGVVYGVMGMMTSSIHRKGPWEAPFAYISVGILIIMAMCFILGTAELLRVF